MGYKYYTHSIGVIWWEMVSSTWQILHYSQHDFASFYLSKVSFLFKKNNSTKKSGHFYIRHKHH